MGKFRFTFTLIVSLFMCVSPLMAISLNETQKENYQKVVQRLKETYSCESLLEEQKSVVVLNLLLTKVCPITEAFFNFFVPRRLAIDEFSYIVPKNKRGDPAALGQINYLLLKMHERGLIPQVLCFESVPENCNKSYDLKDPRHAAKMAQKTHRQEYMEGQALSPLKNLVWNFYTFKSLKRTTQIYSDVAKNMGLAFTHFSIQDLLEDAYQELAHETIEDPEIFYHALESYALYVAEQPDDNTQDQIEALFNRAIQRLVALNLTDTSRDQAFIAEHGGHLLEVLVTLENAAQTLKSRSHLEFNEKLISQTIDATLAAHQNTKSPVDHATQALLAIEDLLKLTE